MVDNNISGYGFGQFLYEDNNKSNEVPKNSIGTEVGLLNNLFMIVIIGGIISGTHCGSIYIFIIIIIYIYWKYKYYIILLFFQLLHNYYID